MPIRGLDHINIGTARLEETCRFFADCMDLKPGYRPDFPFGGAWLYHGDQAVVHIVEKAADMRPSAEAALDHFAFAAHGYDETVARLKDKAIGFAAIAVPGTRIRQLFLRDPNGVNIELNFQGD
jgi:catechol 2,3-dioxygenase-like lactoylglutathione lyase family enzyme